MINLDLFIEHNYTVIREVSLRPKTCPIRSECKLIHHVIINALKVEQITGPIQSKLDKSA